MAPESKTKTQYGASDFLEIMNNNDIFRKKHLEFSRNENVLFWHVPRTAGSSFWSFCRTRLNEVLFGLDIFSGSMAVTQDIYTCLPMLEAGLSARKHYARQSPEISRNVIHHHTLFPIVDQIKCAKIVLLRDPIERVVSYWKHTGSNLSIDQFVEENPWVCWKYSQCIYNAIITGNDEFLLAHPSNFMTKQQLTDRKYQIIERFDALVESDEWFFGISERLQDTVFVVCLFFDVVSDIEVPFINKSFVNKQEFSQSTVDMLNEYCSVDMEIYRKASKYISPVLDIGEKCRSLFGAN